MNNLFPTKRHIPSPLSANHIKMWSDTITKNSELCTKIKNKKYTAKNEPSFVTLKNVAMAHRNYFRQNNLRILKLATYTKIEDHYFRCKLATFQIGKDCQMFIFYFVYTKHQVLLINL